ncbi:MAG: DUF4159 domain-containing protein [Candidatus Yanofskybacteria bacterium]|nr:DUF4159 domain-containing protein [Candidatus Yanofskybacteria bacterium]
MRVIFAALSFLLLTADLAAGQKDKIWVGPTDVNNPRWATPSDFDGSSLVFCRGYYENVKIKSDHQILGWYVDYPGADHNFLVRIAELTKTRIRRDADGKPVHVVVRLDSSLIFNCPVIFLSDVGEIEFKSSEIDNLRVYFKKGGFLWADDFWGSQAWDHWEYQIRQVLPSGLYPMIDIPETHLITNLLFPIPKVPQIPNIGLWWYGAGKQTSERGEDSKEVHFRGIEDGKGRLIAVMTHNTDIGETWEMEGFDTRGEFFLKFSPTGYGIGINIFLYALIH